jgi:hypothetical protein
VKRRKLDVFEQHALRIARQTVRMPDAMLGVMGGPTKEQARETIRRLTTDDDTRPCIGCKTGRVPYNQGSDYCDRCIRADQG